MLRLLGNDFQGDGGVSDIQRGRLLAFWCGCVRCTYSSFCASVISFDGFVIHDPVSGFPWLYVDPIAFVKDVPSRLDVGTSHGPT